MSGHTLKVNSSPRVIPSTQDGVPRHTDTIGTLGNTGVTIDDNDNLYVPSRVGISSAVDDYSKVLIGGTMEADLAMPAGKSFVDLQGTINITGSFKSAAAFNANITTTDNGSALQFISGMLFTVNKNGTGSWGANAGLWGQAPTLVAARWESSAGSSSLGNWGNTFFSGTPDFAASGGSFSAGTFNHFEAGKITDAAEFDKAYGLYVWNQNSTTESAAIFIRGGTVSSGDAYGIVINDDGDGGRIAFGAGYDATITYDGTNMVYNSQLAGSGKHSFTGGAIIPIAGAYNNCSIQSPNEAGTGLYFPSAGRMYLNCGGATGGLLQGAKSSGNFSNFGIGVVSTDDRFPWAIQRNQNNTMIMSYVNANDGASAAVYDELSVGAATPVKLRFGCYSVASSGNAYQQRAAVASFSQSEGISFIQAGVSPNDIRFYVGGGADANLLVDMFPNYVEFKKGFVDTGYETITASSDTLDDANHIVYCDTSSNAITINLPAAASHDGREYKICCVDPSNAVTVDANGSELINDELTQVVRYPNTMVIHCNGTEWRII